MPQVDFIVGDRALEFAFRSIPWDAGGLDWVHSCDFDVDVRLLGGSDNRD